MTAAAVPNTSAEFASDQYGRELEKNLRDLGIRQNEGLLACYNEDAALAYQCRVDTDCCGVGPKARNDGAWNKCCVAGNSSGVELDVWVTLAACMGLLVLFVAGILLYVERRRRGALQKAQSAGPAELAVELPRPEQKPGAAGVSGRPSACGTPQDAPRPVVTVATPSPPVAGNHDRRSVRLVALDVKQRLFGSPGSTPVASPQAQKSLAPGGVFSGTERAQLPDSPPCYPISPETATEKPTVEVGRNTWRRGQSRFHKESVANEEATTGAAAGQMQTPTDRRLVSFGSVICPPSMETPGGTNQAVCSHNIPTPEKDE
mmetsp:Transcript_13942/g.35098  ORF Transcript_13942/g.35098 Transcript_13942/m.35098 type:complete len:318 (+) Transcript_13942:183-1136(+)|eukprot:jgi/Tetstr1/448081/TSEL_035380.t1